MTKPALVVTDEDKDALRDVERELGDRYARHYDILCSASRDEAIARLEELAEGRQEVALVLEGPSPTGELKGDVLRAARRLHPDAKRGLMIAWGQWGQEAAGDAIFDSMADGLIDHFLVRPGRPPDELFHQAISSLLLEWAEARRDAPYSIEIVGASWAGRAYELRATLERCAIPHSFYLSDSPEGERIVEAAGDAGRLPLVAFPDGTILTDPSGAEIARAAGSPTDLESIEFDIIVVGAGPAGLSAAVYGASEGYNTLVVDEGGIGGQATSSSLIRNYLGFPRGLSGRRLAQQAYDQAWMFGAKFAFMQRVTGIERTGEELVVSLSDGGPARCHAVVLAMGVEYRRLGVPELEALNGAGVFYGGPASEAPSLGGSDVYVLGGANSAGQAALHLAQHAGTVTLVVRADSLAAGMSDYLVRQIEASPTIEVRLGTEITGGGGDGRLEELVLRSRAQGNEEKVKADALFLMIGAHPRTDWLPPEIQRDEKGFVLTGWDLSSDGAWPLEREPLLFETGMPGVLAAGDVRHGSSKRVASAVGEGSVAIQTVHRIFDMDGHQPRARSKERSEV